MSCGPAARLGSRRLPIDVGRIAARIAAGERDQRLRPRNPRSELGRMAASFDAMVDALEAAEQARAAEMRDLVDNALAATGGGGAIGVELARSGGSDVARVIDDGPGVAPGERERIFDGFAPPRRNT